MSTKFTGGIKPGETCTEFQLHRSQNSMTYQKGIFDYSEFRLKRYIEQIIDEKQKESLVNVLKEYKRGNLAIAWKSGKPVWLKVTKDKK